VHFSVHGGILEKGLAPWQTVTLCRRRTLRFQDHRAQGGNHPAGGLRPRQPHGSRRAEGYSLLGDDDRRVTHRFEDMLRIFDELPRVGGRRN
jgi:hypothetical protein